MPAFSRRSRFGCAGALALICAAHGGCIDDDPALGGDTAPHARARPVPPPRVPQPVDAGEETQSRNLLQHFIARDGTASKLVVPRGEALELEATSWQLPFKSKRIVATLLTIAARDEIDDLSAVLPADATWGHPDARRPRERPIFDDGGERFLAAFRRAATRFDERSKYNNPSNFMMGIQEHLRSGAEPMWAFYESGYDRLLFRFIVKAGRARVTYVGLYDDDVPTAPPALDGLGPAPTMTPPMRKEGGEITFGVPKRSAPRGAPPPTAGE